MAEPDLGRLLLEGHRVLASDLASELVERGYPDRRGNWLAHRNLGGELVLENGLRFSFTVEDSAVGAQFSATREQQNNTSNAGLSSLPDVPSGA